MKKININWESVFGVVIFVIFMSSVFITMGWLASHPTMDDRITCEKHGYNYVTQPLFSYKAYCVKTVTMPIDDLVDGESNGK